MAVPLQFLSGLMKICFYNVTASFIPGGLETYCWEAGRALASRGHDVEIVAGNRGAAWHDEVRLVQFPFRVEQDWPDFGTRFRRLMERHSFSRESLPYLLAADYDAIVVNKPFDLPILWRARRRGLKAVTVFSSGGTDFFRGDRWFAGAIDHWMSTSRHNAAQVAEHFGKPVSVIYSGVDTDRFRPMARQPGWRAAHGIDGKGLLLVSVGRLVGLKGLRVVLDALSQIDAPIHFVVVGEGPEEGVLKARAAQLGLCDRVHFLGRVPHEQLPPLLSEMDLLVQPSIGAEAFGISVVEAMACGLPVFASDLGGLRETVVDGLTGRLIPQADVAAWRSALAEADQDRAKLAQWGATGRARVQQEFTWVRNAMGLETLLGVCSEQGAAPCAA
jgi:glycosyltransferase involved in cell wall biosynthesis